MNGATPLRVPAATSIATKALGCALAVVGITTATAVVIVAMNLGEDARATLRFGFGGVDHTRTQAGRIAVHNARYGAGILVCAAVLSRLPRWTRVATDCLLATVLALNAGAVGIAFGAYRWRAVSATAPHLPVEIAGLSLAGGAYLHARQHTLAARSLIATAGACALLLVVAASIETYVSMR